MVVKVSKRTYVRKQALPVRKIARLMKRQALKAEETKKVTTGLSGGGSWGHNTLYSVKLNNISQGTDIGSRVGDKVFYCGFNVRMQVAASASYPNTLFRAYIIRVRDTTTGTSSTAWGTTAITPSLMFRNADTAGTSFVNTDQVTILASKRVKIDARFSGETPVREFKMNARIMRDFQFRTGTQEGEHFNYYLVCLPISTIGVPPTGTVVISAVVTNVQQIFKDA